MVISTASVLSLIVGTKQVAGASLRSFITLVRVDEVFFFFLIWFPSLALDLVEVKT